MKTPKLGIRLQTKGSTPSETCKNPKDLGKESD
jgi:hypothetical protein